MTAPTPPVALKACPVTQADRDAAYELLIQSGDTLTADERQKIAEMRAGKWDQGPAVQAFARHRTTPDAAAMQYVRDKAQFLSDRLDDLEWMEGELEETLRDFMGHVDPAHSRLKGALADLAASTAPTDAGIGAGEGKVDRALRSAHLASVKVVEMLPPAALDEHSARIGGRDAPDRIWLIDAGGGEIYWSDEPDEEGGSEVEFVRAGQPTINATDLAAIGEALGLFSSVIKSGEPWTGTCERVRVRASEALTRLAAPTVAPLSPSADSAGEEATPAADEHRAELTRSPAQFFFEVGYGAAYAEALIRNGVTPFPHSDALVARAWEAAGEDYEDPAEFDRYFALATSPRAAGDRLREAFAAMPVDADYATADDFRTAVNQWWDSTFAALRLDDEEAGR